MEVVLVADATVAARLVADAIEALLRRKPDAVLGVATGSSPLPIYAELVRRYATGAVSFAAARAFLLDEYLGLPPTHPQSYRMFIEEHLAAHVDFAPGAVRGPDTTATDVASACVAYETAIREVGGVDLQILGIGTDGHIGFNEPVSSLGSRTRVKTLAARTRMDNSRYFGSLAEVPQHVITQGVATILDARHVVLVATGTAKAAAVAAAVEGPVTAMCPASALQLHPHVSIVVDEEAAASLTMIDYYRATWRDKPSWQGL